MAWHPGVGGARLSAVAALWPANARRGAGGHQLVPEARRSPAEVPPRVHPRGRRGGNRRQPGASLLRRLVHDRARTPADPARVQPATPGPRLRARPRELWQCVAPNQPPALIAMVAVVAAICIMI